MLNYESNALEAFIWFWWQAKKEREEAESHWHFRGIKLKESGGAWEGFEARFNRY